MLQNTFHFVCRHYEGSYSEISVIRFVVPVCFASGLLHAALQFSQVASLMSHISQTEERKDMLKKGEEGVALHEQK